MDGREIGFAFFKTNADAQDAINKLPVLYGISAQFARSTNDPQDALIEPSDTLCIVGFSGTKYELRRYLHDFRNSIISVRRRKCCIRVASLTCAEVLRSNL